MAAAGKAQRILIDARPRNGALHEAQLRNVRSLVSALAKRSPENRYFVLLGEDATDAFAPAPGNLEVEQLGTVPVRFWFDRFGARALARRWQADLWVSMFQTAPRVGCPTLSAVQSPGLSRPGIDLEAFAPAPIDLAARRVILSEPADEEAAEFLIRSYVRLAEHVDAPDLVLIGAQDWPRALWTRRLSPEARGIQVHRTVSERMLRSHYGRARLVVVPGDGAVAEHAMLAGLSTETPVVSVDLPGLRRIGGNAVAFARADSEESLAKTIEEFLSHTELAEELARRGRVRAGEFSWDRAAQAFEEACRGAFQDRSKAASHSTHGFDRSAVRA